MRSSACAASGRGALSTTLRYCAIAERRSPSTSSAFIAALNSRSASCAPGVADARANVTRTATAVLVIEQPPPRRLRAAFLDRSIDLSRFGQFLEIEPVANAPHALEKARRCGRRLDLLPQVGNLVVHDAFGDCGVPTPDLVDQRASREHSPNSPREEFEQLQLERCRGYGLAIAPKFGSTEIELAVTEGDDLRQPGVQRTPEMGTYTRPQLLRAVRLGDVVDSNEIETEHLVGLAATRGQQQNLRAHA